MPEGIAQETLSAPYNDLASVKAAFERHGADIAAVIVEPVAANMGVIPPAPGFLDGLRAITQQHGALLIFDEVVTGFRVGYGGAQGAFGIVPDLTCLGKIVGGGLPLSGVRRPAQHHGATGATRVRRIRRARSRAIRWRRRPALPCLRRSKH